MKKRFCQLAHLQSSIFPSSCKITIPVLYVFVDHHIDTRNVQKLQIMFMSMGEPALNQKNVVEAIERLHRLYPNADLLLSTAAPDVDFTLLFGVSERIPKVGLQFSVHESTDEARNALIRFRHKLTLAEIAQLGSEWAQVTGRRPFFNYCAHAGNSY